MEEQLWYDRYRPLGLISAGNGTEVYLVEHAAIREQRIIKRADRGTEAEKLLLKEAELLKQLNSPLVPRLYDVIADETGTALVEEYIGGESLDSFIKRGAPLTFDRFCLMVRSLCEALVCLHREAGYIHCDLKPENLMIRAGKLVLLDFGAAAAEGRNSLNEKNYGTPGFEAPEQKSGELITEAADVYSLGRILELLLARLKGTEDNGCSPHKLRSLRRLAEKATAADETDRFQTTEEFLKAFERCRDRKKADKGLHHIRGTMCTVGILGTSHGVGTTHTALSAANYLCNVAGKRVAVVELSETKELTCLEEKSLHMVNQSLPKPCRLAGFDVFPAADSLRAGAVRNGNYDYCILDLGCATGYRMQELLRCDKKLILTDVAPWKKGRRERIESILSQAGKTDSWWVMFNLTKNVCPKDCRRLPVRTVTRSFSPDPFETSEQDEKLFNRLLSAF